MGSASLQKSKEARVKRLAEAKTEANSEIQGYRNEQESEFQLKHSTDAMGGQSQKLVAETKSEIDTMRRQFNSNKKAVLDMMIHVAGTVVIVVPEARKRGLD